MYTYADMDKGCSRGLKACKKCGAVSMVDGYCRCDTASKIDKKWLVRN